MDRNTILLSSRKTFLASFRRVIEGVVHQSIGGLFDKADKSASTQEQRHLLDARTILVKNEATLVRQISEQLETLLHRSYQTAYDTFRPSFFNAGKSKPLALMDMNAFEDDLRIDLITGRFRSEAEEQLRDLNIRIAILFERNDIAERENPFRPYLLTRAIVLAVEAMGIETELLVNLTDQIAEQLLPKVATLYEEINQHLSDCGVAAQLQFKSQRMPSDLTNPVGYAGDQSKEDPVQDYAPQRAGQPAPAYGGQPQQPQQGGRAGRIEQLINVVKARNSASAAGMFAGGSAASLSAGAAAFAGAGPQGNGASGGLFGGGGGAAGGGFGGTGGGFGGGGGGASGGDGGMADSGLGGLLNQAGAAVSGWLEGAQEVGGTLRKVFFGGGTRALGGAGGGDAGGDTDWAGGGGGANGQGEGQYIAISPQLQHALLTPIPATAEMFGTDGEVRNLIIERRDNLNSLANDQHEKMTIDIVAMLFEFILKDHQVPAEVRAQLGRLQFSVLKMALMDSALLTKKSHPARLLVNRIGSISVGLQQVDPTGERISAEICRIVEELLTHDAENPELFSKMLDQLDNFIARELLASNSKIEKAVKVVANAELRTQRLNSESIKLEKMLEGLTITPYLRRFLLDTWSHVIERVERNPSADSTRFRLLVPNLLWSILPKASRDDRSMLLQIIPIVVPILREGMTLVAWLPEHQQELLNWLVDAHTTVMRSALSEEPMLSLVDIQRHFHEFVYPDAAPLPAQTVMDKVDVNRAFLDEAIKELEKELQEVGVLQDLDQQVDLGDDDADIGARYGVDSMNDTRGPSATAGSPAAAAEPDHAIDEVPPEEDILDRLRSGVVVEINLSGSPTKGRLNWISPNSTNLILTVNGQEAPSIISVRMFRRMLKNSRARFVEVAPLFERAVQSLLESADLVDLAHAA